MTPIDFGTILMGGFGSGNWYRNRAYKTVEMLMSFSAIDFTSKNNMLIASSLDEFTRTSIRLRYVRVGNTAILFFPEQKSTRSSVPVAPIIKIVSTPCNFGGSREWLLCPEPTCGRRVLSLFIDEHHRIACRKCLGLLYESQYGGGIEKRMTRLRAMHRKIFQGGAKQIAAGHKTQQQFQSLIDDLRKITRGAM